MQNYVAIDKAETGRDCFVPIKQMQNYGKKVAESWYK